MGPLGLALLVSLPFLVLAARRPVARRLATRNSARRPRETVLVILGSLLGTAIITSAFVVGDTLQASLRRGIYTQLGPVDELVAASSASQQAEIVARLRNLPPAALDGVLPITAVTAAVASTGTSPRAEPNATLVEVDFAAARTFGRATTTTGLGGAGPTPAGAQAVIGRDLARTLHAGPGTAVQVFAYGESRLLTVTRVVGRLGVAGFNPGRGSSSPNLFVAPGTIAAMQAQSVRAGLERHAAPPETDVAISNVGGVVQTKARSDAVAAEIDRLIPDLPVTTIKADRIAAAADQGRGFTQLFTTVGVFSVLAGLLLLVNIFVMLAQERKSELGMLRAMGLRRSGLLALFSLEGWLYALASAAAGTLVGIGVGRVVVTVASGIFGRGRYKLDLTFSATRHAIDTGFAAGFVIATLTVVASSVGISRLNVIRAIRELPDPVNPRGHPGLRVAGILVVVLGALLTASAVVSSSAMGALVGPAAVAAGLVFALRGVVARRGLVTLCAGAALVWSVLIFGVLRKAAHNGGIGIFVAQGVILTAAAVAIVTQNQDVIGGALRRLGGGSRNMSLRLGLAYPLARRGRTALILVSYSLVVFTLTFITILSSLFGRQAASYTRKVSGGFNLLVRSNPANPVPPEQVATRPGVRAVAVFDEAGANITVPGVTTKPVGWSVASYDPTFVRQGPPALTTRDRAYATDQAAYEATMTDPTVAIVPHDFLHFGSGPQPGEHDIALGDRVTIVGPDGSQRAVRVIGIGQDRTPVGDALVAPQVMATVFGRRTSPTELLVATAAGTDPQAVADRINGDYVADGADASSFRKLVNDDLAHELQFFHLMEGYLALGLVVGIAGLGVVMVRAVHERRHQIGVLRALGFGRSAVRRAFVAESTFVAAEGIVIGAALALVTSWRVATSQTFGEGLRFGVPWGPLALLLGTTLAVSLLATTAPARQAAGIRPAVALRLAD